MSSITKCFFTVLCFIAGLAITSTEMAGQANITELYSPEKLFIHTDKSSYVAGENIWFRGYLANKSQKSVIPESNFIYVEVYCDTLVSRVKIKRNDNRFEGNLQLPQNLKSGNYTIRAYTQWMLNYSTEYMFYKQIFIINPLEKNIPNQEQYSVPPLSDIMFFPESGRYFSERFSIFAFKTFDSLGRGTPAITELYNSKDSLIGTYKTEHNGMGWFRFYPIESENYYMIAYPTKDIESIKKTLPPPSKTGAVINLVKRGNKTKEDTKLFINTLFLQDPNSTLCNSYFLIIHDGTEIYHSESLTYPNKNMGPAEKTIILNEKELPQGINHILITDSNYNIIAERLFFVYPSNPANISLAISKNGNSVNKISNEDFGKREKVTCKFNIKDSSNNPLQGNFSIAVTDSFLSPPNLTSDNLFSYMELSSELKGVIENPTFYFDQLEGESTDWTFKKRAMDLLMMVQGWRYYNLPAIFNNPHYLTSNNALNFTKDNNSALGKKEKTLSKKEKQQSQFYPKELIQIIEGRASGAFRNTKKATISILAPAINLAVSENLNRSGNFTVTDVDFPDSTNFIISCMGKEEQKGFYIDTKEFRFPPIKEINYTQKNTKKIDENALDLYLRIYSNTGGDIVTILNTVVVTASPRVTPKENPSPYNQSFDKRQFRERDDLEMYEGMSLLDYIISSFPGLTYGPTLDNGLRSIQSTRATTILGDNQEPKVFVNRSPVQSTGDLDMYTVDDIENVAFLKGNDSHLFQSLSGVILVNLRTSLNKNARGVNRNYNTKLYAPLGWQKPSKFYSPDYSLKQDNETEIYDTRSTLYWNPFVTTDNNGNAQVTFYTSDRLTRFHINVQGVTQDGRYFILK